jgi:hypothetical protein
MVDDSNHTVDELFQILVRARDFPPVKALREIEDHLALDKLKARYHIIPKRRDRPARGHIRADTVSGLGDSDDVPDDRGRSSDRQDEWRN